MKRIALSLFSGILLSACALPQNLLPVEPKAALPEHVTYLVLSQVGRYDGAVVSHNDELFLENYILFTGAPGTALPGKDKVTSTSGVEFLHWVSYEFTGALTVYDEVPKESGKILYAYFASKAEDSGPAPTPGESITITCTNNPDWITNDGCKVFASAWGDGVNAAWYPCTYGTGDKPTTFSFTIPSACTGFLLARCHGETIEPNWNERGNVAGRVYNKTDDISIVQGQLTYSTGASAWKSA